MERANAGVWARARRGVGANSKPSKIDNIKRWPSAAGVRARGRPGARGCGHVGVGVSCLSRDKSVS